MQHSDNHIDDIFRRAAENYQLNTQQTSWGEVAGKLGNKKYKRYFIFKSIKRIRTSILLLLMVSGAGTGFYFLSNTPKSQSIDVDISESSSSIKIISSTAVAFTGTENSNTKNSLTLKKKRNLKFVGFSVRTISVPLFPVEKKMEISSNHTNAVNSVKQKNKTIPAKDPAIEQVLYLNSASITRLRIQTGTRSPAFLKSPKLRIETAADAEPIQVKRPIFRKKMYAQFVAGLGFTVVKNQHEMKPGLEFGIKAGYRFHNKLSLETGLIVAKRNYFSDGKYFKMDQSDPSMPGGMQIISLEGSSYLFQVPLRLKIDFLQKKRSNVFITAGLSSSLLLNEKNNYLTLLNGVKQQITTSYKTQRYYFAAASEISAGYQFDIYKNRSIRIEPYLQVPIKGIGVGKMPLTGAGLHVGFSIF